MLVGATSGGAGSPALLSCPPALADRPPLSCTTGSWCSFPVLLVLSGVVGCCYWACCWMLLGIVGCCWVSLDVVGCCWWMLLLDVVGCCWVLFVRCCWVLISCLPPTCPPSPLAVPRRLSVALPLQACGMGNGVGRCWMLLGAVGCCWMLLDVHQHPTCCWVLPAILGVVLVHS